MYFKHTISPPILHTYREKVITFNNCLSHSFYHPSSVSSSLAKQLPSIQDILVSQVTLCLSIFILLFQVLSKWSLSFFKWTQTSHRANALSALQGLHCVSCRLYIILPIEAAGDLPPENTVPSARPILSTLRSVVAKGETDEQQQARGRETE